MTKDELKTLDRSLQTITDDLRRCKVAKTALAGFCAIGSSVGMHTIGTSIQELLAAAERLAEHGGFFLDQVRKLSTFLHEDGDAANGQTAAAAQE